MKELFTSMLQALSDGQSVVLCSILASSGSTPRGAGAKMAVFADGHTVGTIGGGAVEKCSGEKALEVLQSKQSLVQGYCLAPNQVADIGMICGGNVTVYFQYFDPADENGRALLQGILELLRGDDDSWLVYRMDGGCVSAMGTFDEAHGLRFTDCITPEALRPMLLSNAFTKKGDPGYYIEPLTQAGHAYIFGGGHVGPALAPVLASVSLFYAVSHWNSYFNAMLYINNSDMEVITIVLRRLVFLTTQVAEDSTFDWGAAGMPPIKAVKMATTVLSTLPILCIYPFVQKFFTQGVMVGSVKG